MIARAEPFLARLAAENHFALDFTKDAGQINEANLARYQVFVQLQLAPFNMSGEQQQALQRKKRGRVLTGCCPNGACF